MRDEELVTRYQQGQSEAFDELTSRYQKKLYRLAYRMLGNHDDAQDAVQEVHIRLLKSLPNFLATAKFGTWLYRLAANTIIDFHRRRKSRGVHVPIEIELQSPVEQSDPDHHCEAGARQEALRLALQQLPEEQRTLLILRDREGMSNQEVANILGTEVGTLKSRLHRARRGLRKLLESGMPYQINGVTSQLQFSATGMLI